MRQNLGFDTVYNAMGILLAAGLLYPFTGQRLSQMIAAGHEPEFGFGER